MGRLYAYELRRQLDTVLRDVLSGAPAGADERMSLLDHWTRQLVRWHFSPETGSPWWAEQAGHLTFDPVERVNGASDLVLFPDLSDRLRTARVRDLVPAGLALEGPPSVWESGGTTGTPKRIFEAASLDWDVAFASAAYDRLGLGYGGDWVSAAPSGPHVVGETVRRLARLRGGICHALDLDPRHVKRLGRSHRADRDDLTADYVQGVLDQLQDILTSADGADIEVLFTTPRLLLGACERTALWQRLRRLRAIIWTGTSIRPEELRHLQEEILPGVQIVGQFGNTLMGPAVQRPAREGDPSRCVFSAPAPLALIHVVRPGKTAEPEQVPYGERGQVMVHRLNLDVFLPKVLERDEALRVPGLYCDDVADVDSVDAYASGDRRSVIGVY